MNIANPLFLEDEKVLQVLKNKFTYHLIFELDEFVL